MSTSRPDSKTVATAAVVALACAASLSSGFVRERIRSRRAQVRHVEARGLVRVREERWDGRWRGRAGGWQGLRRWRRCRGLGYGRTVAGGQRVRSYVFGGRHAGGDSAPSPLSADVIERIMRAAQGSLGACLIQHGAKRVTLQFDVVGTGRVSKVLLDVSGAAAACLRRVLKRVRFPARPGTTTKGRYTLRLN